MIRAISHSEVQDALDCQAKHAFKYTGRMTGGLALSAKRTAPLLRDGRAWGAAVAAYHQTGHLPSAHAALQRSLEADADEQRAEGLYDEQEFAKTLGRLTRMLDHYISLTERIYLESPEHELLVPIPSRSGARGSTKYRLHCFLDGVEVDEDGRYWIVEFKLRNRLQSDELIAASRQIRWYAWAWARETHKPLAGVIVDERLNDEPSSPKFNKDGTLSKVQSCTPEAYEFECQKAGAEPDAEVLARLRAKVYQKRSRILFRRGELEEAGWQLTSAANLIRQLDDGTMHPIRNPSPARCPGCAFKQICQTPNDGALVDLLFNRELPKGQRAPIERRAA